MPNKKIIGLDLHSATCDACIMTSEKKIIKRFGFETSEENLIEVAKSNGKNCEIVFEEGSLAGWAYQILLPYCQKVVVSDPKQNKWIYKADDKDDHIDAKKLCELYIGGFIKEIYHPVGDMSELRDMILFYHKTTKHLTRFKNQIRAAFRSKGIQTTSGVYSNRYNEFAEKLKSKTTTFQTNMLYGIIKKFENEKEKIVKQLKKISKNNATLKLLKKIPGIGFIYGITLIGIIVTPERFATKRKLWSYAGFSIVKKGSAGKYMPPHLSNNYNRILKNVTKQAVHSILRSNKKNKFKN